MNSVKEKSSLVKKILIFTFFLAFLVMGILAMKRAMPEPKEARIYEAIKVYSPYKLEKKIGGLYILNTKTEIKESPSSAEVLHRLDELDQFWGKEHLSIDGNDVIVKKDDNTTVKIPIESQKERDFLKRFFGV